MSFAGAPNDPGLSFGGGGVGLLGARPAASASANQFYFATDTGEAFFSNGTSWLSISTTTAPTFHAGSANSNGAYMLGPSGISISAAGSTVWNVNSADWDIASVGKGLRIAEGSNAKQGLTAAMTSGVVTTNDSAVTANSRIFYSQQSGTLTGVVTLTRVAGTSFTLTSSINTDTAAFAYLINEPG